MRLKKGGEFPLQKNLSENVYKFPFDKNSSRLVDNIIIIVITTLLTWLLSRSLILSSSYYSYYHCQHYFHSHLVIILLTCPFNCAVASRLKGKYQKNEKMPLKKKVRVYLSDDCQLEELGKVVDDGKGSDGENISSGRPKMRHL